MRQLSLDTILSASTYFVRKWSPDLARNQSRDLLRFLLCRLYDQGKGKLVGTQLTLAQGTLGRKLGLSRQWTGILLLRLREAGWIDYAAPKLENGKNSSSIFCIGNQLKRLLVMLGKRKPQQNQPDKNQWKFSPSKETKRMFLIQRKEEEPLRPEILARIPLLAKWITRGTP